MTAGGSEASIGTAVDDAGECARITRVHARTFSLASRLLPADKRRAAFALYAFCRIADDLVDQADHGDRVALRAQLEAYRQQLRDALAGAPSGPVFRELASVTRRYAVDAAPLFELLDGVERDLEAQRYATWEALERYCQGVASSVGEMCTYVFGVPAGAALLPQAIRFARTLGTAMQLTNILRDVGEDAQRGRCYLPAEDLARFGLATDEVMAGARTGLARDPRWARLMAFEVSRARALYDAAVPGIALLAPDAQGCAAACATGYAGILGAIEAQGYDTLTARARLGRLARVGILWQAWRYRPPVPDLSALRRGPRVEWEPNTASASADALVRLA
ncbi:MAG: phytoene/squalene synthase family protein [Gemmatimonadetes bacterium]|nr:phytoene/squalene synthase family protein [Gemmatimonadota bacterium]